MDGTVDETPILLASGKVICRLELSQRLKDNGQGWLHLFSPWPRCSEGLLFPSRTKFVTFWNGKWLREYKGDIYIRQCNNRRWNEIYCEHAMALSRNWATKWKRKSCAWRLNQCLKLVNTNTNNLPSAAHPATLLSAAVLIKPQKTWTLNNTWKYLSSAPETSTMYMLTTKVVVATFPIDWQTAHRRKNMNSNQYLKICEIMMENWPAIAITSTPKRKGFRPILEPKKLAALQPSTAARTTLVCFHNKERQKQTSNSITH